MAIYNIFDQVEKQRPRGKMDPKIRTRENSPYIDEHLLAKSGDSSSLFSRVAARFFFFILLLADVAWMVYSFVTFVIKGSIHLMLLMKLKPLARSLTRTGLNLRRSLVCLIALFVALFSPALGIMFSYMYFLMYDREGVDEVVPTSLKEQFDEMF